MVGIGTVIGTGIFVFTAEAAQKAGPGMMVSFVIAGLVCAIAALCYAEMAAMVPVSGSAYTYSYPAMGELLAWMVGWASRFNEIKRRLDGISHKAIVDALKRLEQNGLVTRTVLPTA